MTGILILDDSDRAFLHRMIDEAKVGTLVEMHVDIASEKMRRKMWAMLGEIAKQYCHQGKYYAPEQLKLVFMHACGQEIEMMPSLDGSTFLPYEGRSSRMRAEDMNQLISFLDAWAAENGIKLKEVD